MAGEENTRRRTDSLLHAAAGSDLFLVEGYASIRCGGTSTSTPSPGTEIASTAGRSHVPRSALNSDLTDWDTTHDGRTLSL